MLKMALIYKEMISAKFVWGNLLLDGKLQMYAKNGNFERAVYMKSGVCL